LTTDSISYSEAVETARDYYNSADADAFYANVWGGEDIHVGFYEGADDTIADASRRTVERLAAVLGPPGDASRVLDMGSGYGGMARYLAATCRCNVVGLNLSEVENDRARRLNAEQGLDDLVEIVDGSYDSVPSEAGGFDAVCSQDALLHSDKRDAVVAEAARVLKPGGLFAFTDIMQADSCPQEVLQPIFDRIHLESLGSPGTYCKVATENGLELKLFQDHTSQLVEHYGRVLSETETMAGCLQTVSDEYLANMKKGLGYWIEGGERGWLAWGLFAFQKPHDA
tara:strand:- start:61 stop:912 length:852 start_codon:yes stop_codon:yes gene_type:complete